MGGRVPNDGPRARGDAGAPASHAVPVFAGRGSRSHERKPVAALRREAAEAPSRDEPRVFVQFAGFPRSGHSILGSILDAHPDALVSHELDAMGLLRAGLSLPEILALVRANSAAFERDGRWWNGFSYAIPGAAGGASTRPSVMGDKKGDWALRHVMAEPGLLDALRGELGGRRAAWIAVVRNPYDNVATLSLRKGRLYDRERIEAASGDDFAARLASRRGDGIAAAVLPEMVEDYARLCDGLAALKARVDPADWLELRQDRFVAAPEEGIAEALRFLGLPDEGFAARAVGIVERTPSRTRHAIRWPEEARRAVDALVARHDFLAGFVFEEPAGRAAAGRAPAGRAAAAPRLVTCVGVEHDLPLLGHFLDHYAALGVAPDRMHPILQSAEPDAPGLARAREILARRGAEPAEEWIGPYTSAGMWERRRAVQERLAAADDWVLNADADEFHDYPAPLGEVIAFCEERGVRCVQGPFVDRIAPGGVLAAADPDASPWETFPVSADAGTAIGKRPGLDDATGTVKIMLHRGDVAPGLGGHHPANLPEEALLYGAGPMVFPRIKSAAFRFALPCRVWHFKWTAPLREGLERRRATPGASRAGSVYGGRILDYLERRGGRIDLADLIVEERREPAGDWRAQVERLAEAGARIARARRRARRPGVRDVAPGWRVRQLTVGTADEVFHSHSYYDIPVLDPAGERVAAHRMRFQGRWMTPEDEVEIGVVEAGRGGFAPLGTSRAWSWQQGPMAQWLPDGRRLVWNDREGDRFVARLHDVEAGGTRTLGRPVYALDPAGGAALSTNMARLDGARPGYGYVGGAGARLDVGAPEEDGIWRLDLATGEERLILSLRDAVRFLRRRLPREERPEHRSGALVHWFNHLKVSPDGRRFTTKLRWRAADLKGPWTGLMGVSLTCAMDGTDLRLLARGTSHVMWLDAERLYLWHQAEGAFATIRDAAPEGADRTEPFPELITRNVHFRHVPEAPDLCVFDTPYAEEIDLTLLRRGDGSVARLARFTGHDPKHGPFRCDLHPVPSAAGDRIVVTSLQDGGRQLYVVERDGGAS